MLVHCRQRCRWCRYAALEQVALHPPQQAVAEATVGKWTLARFERIGVDRDLGERMHHFVVTDQRHEVAPGHTQACSSGFSCTCSANRSTATPVRRRCQRVCRSPQ